MIYWMDKIWTTAFIPPFIEEPDLSMPAMKIISFLQNSERNSFSGGLVPEYQDIWFKTFGSRVKHNQSLEEIVCLEYCNKQKEPIANEKGLISNISCLYPLTTTLRQHDLNESVDMFDDSLTSHRISEVETDIKSNRNSVGENSLQEINRQKYQIENKITNYFPVNKMKTSKPKRMHKINNGCNFSNNVQTEQNYTVNKNVRKKQFNTLDDYIQLQSKEQTNISKNLQKIANQRVLNSLRKIPDMNYNKVSSGINFCDLPKGALKSIKELPCPTSSVSPITIDFDFSNDKKKKFRESLMNLDCDHESHSENNNDNEGSIESLNYEVFYLNQDNIENGKNILFHKDIKSVGMTLCYGEGFCILNKPTTKERCCPNGLLMCANYVNGNNKFIFYPLDGFKEECLRIVIVKLLSSGIQKICYEAQALLLFVLDNIGEDSKRDCYDWCVLDPLVAAWLLDPDHHLHSFEELLKLLSISRVPKTQHWLSKCCEYVKYQCKAMDVLCFQLHSYNLWDVYFNLETKIIPILAVLESSNITINVEIFKKMHTIIQEKLHCLQADAEILTGHSFSLKSLVQIREVLYEKLKLDSVDKITQKDTNEKNNKSTSESMLKLLGKVHPLPLIILEHRQLWKLSSYIESILQYAATKKCVTATWELCATATGRITSSCPNLQTIPKKTINIKLDGKDIDFNLRSCFEARKGFIFVAADFKHIELRILAHLAKDRKLTDLLKQNDDIFKLVTQVRLKQEAITKNDRDQTKTLVYALMYGAGLKKLAKILSVEESEARQIKCSLAGNIYNILQHIKIFLFNYILSLK